MIPGHQETLDWIYKLHDEQKTSRAIYVAEEWIKNLLLDKDFETCEELLETFDVEKAGEWLSLTVLESLSNAMVDGVWESQKIKPLRHKIMLHLLDQHPLPYVAKQMNGSREEILQAIQTMDL